MLALGELLEKNQSEAKYGTIKIFCFVGGVSYLDCGKNTDGDKQNLPDLPPQKSGFPVEISRRKKWVLGLFFSLTPNPMSFWRFADTPPFRTGQDPKNPRIF